MKEIFRNINIQTALALSAASALIYEVVATHLLFFYFVESSYSIATVLSVFLTGLAIGSILLHYLSDKIKNKKLVFSIIQIIIALYAFIILSNLRSIIPKISTMGTFATSFLILLVPTIFLGTVFPLAGLIFKKEKKEVIGLVYSSDLTGAILGSLFAGFLLIPQLGIRVTVIIGAILNIISAFIIISKKQKIIPIFLLLIFVGSTFNIPSILSDNPTLTYEEQQYYDQGYQYYSNSPYGLVTVKNDTLYIEEMRQCSFCTERDTIARDIVVYTLKPLQEYSDVSILNIGLGCGLTLEKCLEYETIIDVVEINEKVVEANKEMSNILENPRINLIVDEGLNYLQKTNKNYDCIIMDILLPYVSYSSNLYTVEAFKIIHDSLTDTGVFSLIAIGENSRYYDILYYSLKESFSYVYYYDYYIMLATKKPLTDKNEYIPVGEYEINTIDRNTLADTFR